MVGPTVEEAAFLSRIPLFASLKPEHLAELVAKLRRHPYRRGEVIFHQDDPGSAMHIIKTGQVKITRTSEEGEETILAIFTGGDFFGELSLLDDEPRCANAVAMEATETLILHRSDFKETLTRHPEMVGSIMSALAQRLRHTDQLVEDAFFLDLPARLSKRLLELAEKHGVKTSRGTEIDLHLTQQDLAAAAGVSRVAINRQLHLFQDSGLISVDKKRIIVLRPEELRKRIY